VTATTKNLLVDSIDVYHGASHALQGVSLQVRPGESVCLLGRNGAGKTTTINTIVGLHRPRRGKISYGDTLLSRLPIHCVASKGIALVPQGRRLFPDLTVRENLLIGARRGDWDLEAVYELFPRVKERERNGANQLSGGEQQMVALGRALMCNPDLLLLDEPSEGLAPLVVRYIGGIIKELKSRGLSILLVEQHLPLALAIADRVYIMNKGRIVFEGQPEQLSADEELKHQYLGV
jgi:branched-chain amino acid transport system ATP-binding protein